MFVSFFLQNCREEKNRFSVLDVSLKLLANNLWKVSECFVSLINVSYCADNHFHKKNGGFDNIV